MEAEAMSQSNIQAYFIAYAGRQFGEKHEMTRNLVVITPYALDIPKIERLIRDTHYACGHVAVTSFQKVDDDFVKINTQGSRAIELMDLRSDYHSIGFNYN
ncbi:MAG: hypothetical protein Q4P13_10690 [Psychrobacter sp.]|nr:hypothetical protein [Psychrobacter sp.]